jgi:hypothetical protein
VLEHLEKHGYARVIFAFLVVLSLNLSVITEPPVWDSAASIFPAGIYLSNNQFDFSKLFQEPGYAAGGPNVHGLSVITLVTAVIFKITGGGTAALVSLHVIHFFITSLVLVSFFDLTSGPLGKKNSFLLCLAILIHPVFLTQSRSMYLEIPLLLFTVNSIGYWVRQEYGKALVFVLLASMTKETGFIVGACIAFYTLFESGSFWRRVVRSVSVIFPVLVLVAIYFLYITPRAMPEFLEGQSHNTLVSFLDIPTTISRCMASASNRFLMMVPDILVAIVCVFIMGAVRLKAILWGFFVPEKGKSESVKTSPVGNRLLDLSLLLVVFFHLLHYVILPISIDFCCPMIRYHVQIIPFLGFILAFFVIEKIGPRVFHAFIALALIGFVINQDGALYPSEVNREGLGSNFGVTERSGAYRKLLTVQRTGIELLSKIPSEIPVFYEHHNHYAFQYPEMGYARQPLKNGHNIFVEEPYRSGHLNDYPPCFVMFYFSPFLGGKNMLRVVKQAEVLPEWESEVIQTIENGPYRGYLIKVWKEGAPCLEDFNFQEPAKPRAAPAGATHFGASRTSSIAARGSSLGHADQPQDETEEGEPEPENALAVANRSLPEGH